MKILLDIKDSKASFIMELLKKFSFVKTKPLSDSKAEILEGIRKSVEEMNLIKAGKLKARNAEDLYVEL